MKKNNSLKNNSQLLSKVEKKAHDKACSVLVKIGWEPRIELDPDWGWIILAAQYKPEIVLRRIKLFALNSLSDFDRALKIQDKVRLSLVEVSPYKNFLGNKISLSDLDKPFSWFSKADFLIWTKFFKSKKDMENY